MYRLWNGIAHFFEWLTIYAFFQNFYLIVTHAQVFTTDTPLGQFLSSDVSLYIVAGIFLVLGAMLGASKIFKRKRLHKNALFWTYITLVYVTVLEGIVSGFGWVLFDNALLMVGIAYAWLRWKFRTEYVDTKKFHRHAARLRMTDEPH